MAKLEKRGQKITETGYHRPSLDVLSDQHRELEKSLDNNNPFKVDALKGIDQKILNKQQEILLEHKNRGKDKERAELLESIQTKLNKIQEKVDEKRDQLGDQSVFQLMDRDTQRDMQRIPVLIRDLAVSPEQRRQEKKIAQRQEKADELVSNDLQQSRFRVEAHIGVVPVVNYISMVSNFSHRTTGKSLGSLDNRLKHKKGYKLQQKYGSAELETHREKQNFREREYDNSQLQEWLENLNRRESALGRLEHGSETQYISRYQALERGQRLDPDDKENIREVKRALRKTDDPGEIKRLYTFLPTGEVEKWQHLLNKEVQLREKNVRKENRTTAFENTENTPMDDTRLMRLLDGAKEELFLRRQATKEELIVWEYTTKLGNFIKDISGETNSAVLALKSNDVLRQIAGKRPKNMTMSGAIEKIPENFRGRVIQELTTSQRETVYSELAAERSSRSQTILEGLAASLGNENDKQI